MRRPLRSTRTYTLLPYTTLVRSIALELLGVGHLTVERLGIGDRLFEIGGLLFEALWRPVGQLPVELMLALIDGEIGIEREIASKKIVAKLRSEEQTSELQSLMRISYAVFCLKKQNNHKPQS